jgi:DNA end-binding protein Ku
VQDHAAAVTLMAARSIWKAGLVLGEKRIAVDLYAAVEDRDVHLHLLHQRDRVRVRQRLADPTTGRTVPTEQARRGFEVERGRFVVLEPDELAALEPKPSRDIEVVAFVPRTSIDHRWYERPYYLGPSRGHARDYFALAAAMERTQRDGFARWVMRKREYAGALRLHAGYLALIALRHAGEVVVASELQPPTGRELEARERQLASQLIGALSGPFEHEQFRDEYRERLLELVATKQKGKKIDLERYEPEPVDDTSLVAALQRSLKTAG